MEKYSLNLNRGYLNPVRSLEELRDLGDRVFVVDILSSDFSSPSERPVFCVKLVGLLIQNSSVLYGLRFKEDFSGEHFIFDQKHRKFRDEPERLDLREDLLKRNAYYVSDSDRNFKIAHILNGIIG